MADAAEALRVAMGGVPTDAEELSKFMKESEAAVIEITKRAPDLGIPPEAAGAVERYLTALNRVGDAETVFARLGPLRALSRTRELRAATEELQRILGEGFDLSSLNALGEGAGRLEKAVDNLSDATEAYNKAQESGDAADRKRARRILDTAAAEVARLTTRLGEIQRNLTTAEAAVIARNLTPQQRAVQQASDRFTREADQGVLEDRQKEIDLLGIANALEANKANTTEASRLAVEGETQAIRDQGAEAAKAFMTQRGKLLARQKELETAKETAEVDKAAVAFQSRIDTINNATRARAVTPEAGGTVEDRIALAADQELKRLQQIDATV